MLYTHVYTLRKHTTVYRKRSLRFQRSRLVEPRFGYMRGTCTVSFQNFMFVFAAETLAI